MGAKTTELTQKQIDFIAKQHIFFIGTADDNSTVNISPKGGDCIRIIDNNLLVMLFKTGNGNETAAHTQYNPRLTMMWCSFDEKPLILRLYGKAVEIRKEHEQYEQTLALFDDTIGARQLFAFDIELTHQSCGFGVPFYKYLGDRPTMNEWASKKGEKGVQEYIEKHNQVSLDGKPIKI